MDGKPGRQVATLTAQISSKGVGGGSFKISPLHRLQVNNLKYYELQFNKD